MPRGFLVKRSRRPGGSYRIPPAGGPTALRLGEAPRLATPLLEPPPQPQQPPQPDSPLTAVWGTGTSDNVAPPAKESEGCLPSPVSVESSPLAPALALAEKLPLLPCSPMPLPGPLPLPAAAPFCPAVPLKRPSRTKAPLAKKPKAVRKLSFADEVTTSPVLGLRIKAAAETGTEGLRVARSTLLGEFVCQLCKEPYADPLALAQHRCSRIVRVEYRCPECHKIFSCPANLASHRRWHKPRPTTAAGPTQDKENSRREPGRDQHHSAADSSFCPDQPVPRASQLGPAGEAATIAAATPGSGLVAPPGEFFLCPYCHKSFRRQAYLRKHLGTHQVGIPRYNGSSPPPHSSPQQITFSCHLCGAHFPSADIRDKHRLWHAVREELLLPLGQPEDSVNHGEQQIFSCKQCPSTFFSSPGLARHINKCHPSENRQVLLLQMSVRPGC